VAKYLKSKVLLFFLLIPFFKPICFQYYSRFSIIENIFVMWKVVAAIIGALLFGIYVWNYSRISKLVVFVALFEASIVISTVINKGYMSRAIIDAVSVIAFIMIINLNMKYNQVGLIRCASILLSVLVFLNLCSMIIYPNGMSADWYYNRVNALYFMVTDNGSALFLLFSILIFALDILLAKKRKTIYRNLFMILLCDISAVLSFSVTTMIVVALFSTVVYLVFKSNFTKIQNPNILVVLYLIIFVYLMSMQDNVISSFILEKLFNRSSNYSGRYELWRTSIRMIQMNPWIGYGRIARDYIPAWGGYYSSHNYFLEMLLQGGVLALVPFIFIIGTTINRVYKTQHKKITNCLMFALFTIMIAVLMEANVHSVYVFGTIALCYHCQGLEVSVGED